MIQVFHFQKKDIDQYIESDGKNNSATFAGLLPIKFCLITTKGRTTGLWRRTALYYIEYNNDLYLVSSNDAKINQPDWYLNACQNPIVWIEKSNQDSYWGVCHDISEQESLRNIIWSKFCSMAPIYKFLQDQSKDRIFSIVRVRKV